MSENSSSGVLLPEPEEIEFTGSSDNRLVGDLYANAGPPVVFFHGGGQTRHAWGSAAKAVQKAGYSAITVDFRGHGDSAWVPEGAYSSVDFANDVSSVGIALKHRFGKPAVAVGASLGGLASMAAQYEAEQHLFRALILVDVTPRLERDGVERVIGFMAKNSRQGFASIEEAADVIAAYLPNRAKPKSLDGLSKNLRLGDDNRYHWHWDPAFLDGPHPVNSGYAAEEAFRVNAAKAISVPVLLVRGQQSELVSEELAEDFLTMVPHAQLADVTGAGHMVAGDRNDAFKSAIVDFLTEAV